MVFDDTLLDEPNRLAEADEAGLLRLTAMAGAQVRATVELAAELELSERLDFGRPRALVLVSRAGVSHTAAGLLGALLAGSDAVPVIRTDVVPRWIGALDVVFAHTDDPDDDELAVSLERAARYGATVVLSAPPDGPVASAVAGRGILVTPRVTVPAELALPRAFVIGLLTANALGLLTTDIAALADRLDSEAERCHLGCESFVNPAKMVTLRLADRTPLLWGLDRLAVAVGHHAAFMLAAHAATVCDVADYRQAMMRSALYRRVLDNTAGHDIFADPEDSPGLGLPLRVMLLAVSTGTAAERARFRISEALPSADVQAPAEEIEADDAVRAAVLALRLEFAATYLGLAKGTVGRSV